MTKGVLYIATGEEFQKEAAVSAQSVRSTMPTINIAIITDSYIPSDIFDKVIIVDDPNQSFTDQIRFLPNSPYDKTVYLDTDIYMHEPVDELFSLLDQFDIGVAHAQGGTSWPVQKIPSSFPEYNSGVVAYRSRNIQDFCEKWMVNYHEIKGNKPQNQPSFRKTLYESDLRIGTLPREYNCMFRHPGHVNGTVKLFHGRLIDIDGPGAGMYQNPKKAMERINQHNGSRVFTQLGGLSVHSNKQHSIINRARLSAQRRGWRHVFRRGIEIARNKI